MRPKELLKKKKNQNFPMGNGYNMDTILSWDTLYNIFTQITLYIRGNNVFVHVRFQHISPWFPSGHDYMTNGCVHRVHGRGDVAAVVQVSQTFSHRALLTTVSFFSRPSRFILAVVSPHTSCRLSFRFRFTRVCVRVYA